jgi:hypothetical protein
MDHHIALLQEAAQLLDVGSPSRLLDEPQERRRSPPPKIAGGGGGIFSNDHLAASHGIPSPSRMSTVSSLLAPTPGASPLSQQQQQQPQHGSPSKKLNLHNNPATRALAYSMLHDHAATRELVDMLDAVYAAEYSKLAEAQRLLQEEKRVRQAYIESLCAQVDELNDQKRRILVPFLQGPPSPNNGAAASRDDDMMSNRSGNNNNQQQQGSPQQRGVLFPQGTAAGAGAFVIPNNAASAAGVNTKGAPGVGAAASLHSSAGIRNAMGGANNASFIQPGAGSPGKTPQAAVAQQRKLVATIPGVSFGALTTASCATRYAAHWSKEAAESE